jgi:hypothetical protein
MCDTGLEATPTEIYKIIEKGTEEGYTANLFIEK